MKCKECKGDIAPARAELGYASCITCAGKRPETVTRTVVPMHKSNYVLITDPLDLQGINNKGGFHR